MERSASQATRASGGDNTFREAAVSVQQQLEQSLAELAALRKEIADEKIPLSRKLSALEDELLEVGREYQQTTRLLDTRTLDLTNLRSEIESRRQEKTYLSTLLGEYIRSFETRLHIAELQRYGKVLEDAKLAAENSSLSDAKVFEAQATLVAASLEYLHDALGGNRFQGRAVDTGGLVKPGTFVLVGPAALFRSQDGQVVGTAEQRLGSLEPTVIGFETEALAGAAGETVTNGSGRFPLDPTLGNAHKIEATNLTLMERFKKGGLVMYPILALAVASLLVALYKWVELSRLRSPSERRMRALLEAVEDQDKEQAIAEARGVGGPTGEMLVVGAEHMDEPRELIEEVMYEKILTTRLRLQRLLPLIAISASSAPLLGLLGTVTGIINTFKLITVFGAGDVKGLSGGISEALLTTAFGLIVAIPSLLLHAFLSRKARGIVDRMEKAATAFINEVSRTAYRRNGRGEGDLLARMPVAVAREVLRSLGRQQEGAELLQEDLGRRLYSENSAGTLMDPTIVTVPSDATVGEAIGIVRAAELDEDLPCIFVVDEDGKYVGDVRVQRLLTRPENAPIESLVDTNTLYVNVDTDRNDVRILFSRPEVTTVPVVDHDGRLVGRINRNGD